MNRSAEKAERHQAGRRGLACLLPALALALALTLYPFNFAASWPERAFVEFVRGKSHGLDVILNIALFAPLGIGLRWLLDGLAIRSRYRWPLVVVLAGGISLGIELAQLRIPERSAALIDVLANALGAGLGSWRLARPLASIVDQIGTAALNVARHTPALIATLGLALWLAGAGWLLARWQRATLPTNWSNYYTLQIGAASDGRRFWPGYVRAVSLYDRAFVLDDIDQAAIPLFAYNMTRNPPLERGRFGQPLLAQGKPTFTADGVGVGYQRWLMSSDSLRGISAAIAETRAFTLIAEAAPRDPARATEGFIVNYGRGIDGHNISLIQAGSDLVVRMRLPLTRPANDRPALVFSDVFVDSSPHQLIFSYDGAVARLFVDGQPHRQWYAFGPGEALMNRWLSVQAYQIGWWSIALAIVLSLPLTIAGLPWRGSRWPLLPLLIIAPFLIGAIPSLITPQPLGGPMAIASSVTIIAGSGFLFWLARPSHRSRRQPQALWTNASTIMTTCESDP